uniref:Uncharacterized protein n=1 Tax=Cacopsylla melanoneura TaxID=428564 RepID=A0A8D8PWS4_9HEMI
MAYVLVLLFVSSVSSLHLLHDCNEDCQNFLREARIVMPASHSEDCKDCLHRTRRATNDSHAIKYLNDIYQGKQYRWTPPTKPPLLERIDSFCRMFRRPNAKYGMHHLTLWERLVVYWRFLKLRPKSQRDPNDPWDRTFWQGFKHWWKTRNDPTTTYAPVDFEEFPQNETMVIWYRRK